MQQQTFITMTEKLLHFIWQFKYRQLNGTLTSQGQKVEIIDPGIQNNDSGPDFFNAKVKIDDTIWAGNAEIHVNASDWYTHGHNSDPAYNNVILHVVQHNDKVTIAENGHQISTLVLQISENLEKEHNELINSTQWIPCADKLKKVDSLTVSAFIDRLMVERLENKTLFVEVLVNSTNGSWEEAFYQAVVRSFGLPSNALPAEMLAKSLPLKTLAKHKNNLFQLEALIFGQSGLFKRFGDIEDAYLISLKIEYSYLQKKFSLTPIDGNLWKFLRMRPSAFPTIRLAQLAALTHKSSSLFSKTMNCDSFDCMTKLFKTTTSEYWQNHYVFGKTSTKRIKTIGQNTISVIAINVAAPFMYAYGKSKGNEELSGKALKILEQLKPETNSIISNFAELGIQSKNAAEGQSLIHLKKNYCDNKECLRCPLGAKILLKKV